MDVPIKQDLFRRLLHEKFEGSQKALCAAAGISKSACSRASLGGPISWNNCVQLARAFGLEGERELVDEEQVGVASGSVSAGKSNLHSQEADDARIAPFCPPPLVGRADDLAEMTRRIERGLPSDGDLAVQVIVPVRGLPGVGKTALVSTLWYQDDIHHRFSRALYAAVGNVPRSRIRTRLLDILHAWGKALELRPVSLAESVTSATDLLRIHFADKPLLIILDDVWDQDAARQLMIGGGKSATLITTRDNDVARQLAPACGDIYTLKCLSPEESLELLSRLAAPVVKRHPTECAELAERLHGLPFALQIAGRDLLAGFERREDVPTLIHRIFDLSVLLEREAPSDMTSVISDSSTTVAALLSHSTTRLSEIDYQRFAILGTLPPEPATFSLRLLEKVWECPADDAALTIQTLEGRGLLECSGKQRYHLHSLLKAYAQTLGRGSRIPDRGHADEPA